MDIDSFSKHMARILGIILMIMIIMGAFTLGWIYLNVYSDTFGLKGVVRHGNTSEKTIYLTFDDGPSPQNTPAILEVLEEKNVKATFFLLGIKAEQAPKLAKQIHEQGHQIENHGYDHEYMWFKSTSWLESQVIKTNNIIKNITGQSTTLLRPPSGILDPFTKKKIEKLNHTIAFWSLSSKDWQAPTVERMTNRILKKVKPGSIILFHDGAGLTINEEGNRSSTAETLGIIIDNLKEQGYKFKTLSELK